MSELLELQHALQDTSAAVAQLERALVVHPESPVLRVNLESVAKRFEQLQAEFRELAHRNGLDVCTYRLFTAEEEDSPSLRGFSGALLTFQSAFSALFDALKNGRRTTTRLPADVAEATRFGFGYAFSGSVGVVLTIEKERLLLGGGLLDDAVATFFSLAKSPTHDDIREIGRRLGPAPLRAIYKWAKAHADDGLGADISWREGSEQKSSLLVQKEEMARLTSEIAAMSEEVREPHVYPGVLKGASVVTKRFDFEPDGADVISGKFTDAISETHIVRVPGVRYHAHLEKVTKIHYSSEQDIVTWELKKLVEEA